MYLPVYNTHYTSEKQQWFDIGTSFFLYLFIFKILQMLKFCTCLPHLMICQHRIVIFGSFGWIQILNPIFFFFFFQKWKKKTKVVVVVVTSQACATALWLFVPIYFVYPCIPCATPLPVSLRPVSNRENKDNVGTAKVRMSDFAFASSRWTLSDVRHLSVNIHLENIPPASDLEIKN